MSELTAQVFEISRGTTHDGPGMRTTVFLKGCPLRCAWCQNPEGMRTEREIWWEARQCINCRECIAACPHGALADDAHGLHRGATCTVCGACVDACPAQAMAFTSREWSLDGLLHEVLKDREYFHAFGGGVTVSGGEPLCQAAFVSAFFQRLRAEGVHTTLDTCGLASRTVLQSVLPHADAVLFDIKFIDSALHARFTGQPNAVILENLLVIAGHARSHGQTLWIRTPLIPQTTATEENITAVGRFIRERLHDVVERWELCAFNNACNRKYQKMARSWPYTNEPLMRQTTVDGLRTAAVTAGVAEEKLVVSGLIARDTV